MSEAAPTHLATRLVHAYPALGPIGVAGTEPTQAGYLVLIDGRERWVPSAGFEAVYESVAAMSFPHAMFAVLSGNRIARKLWRDGTLELQEKSVMLVASNGTYRSPWRPDQADIFANDWMVVP